MYEPLMTIDGEAVGGESTFEVLNPATGAPIGRCPQASAAQLDWAMHSARCAFTEWRRDAERRRELLRAAADVVRRAAAELGPMFTEEQGRPLDSAVSEIAYSAEWLDFYADLELPEEVTVSHPGRTQQVFRTPIGVVGAITPWNAPILLAMWKIAPALSLGNTMVLKPSPFTPLTTLELARRLARVLPPGVLNVISGREPLGQQLVAHPVPRKIAFTGSVPTGKAVAVAAARDLKRVTLELGGNDAAILLDDVDVESIIAPLFRSAFVNCGQICEATKRVYVPDARYHELLDGLADYARSVSVGNGLDPGVELGPLTTPAQRDFVEALVNDARDGGATIAAGGGRLPSDGYFYAPTIVGGIDDGTRLVDEEQFGPALPVVAYRDLGQVIERINRSPYGLGGSIWTQDEVRARVVAREIDTGRLKINPVGAPPTPQVPFGGIKWSGIGVENGSEVVSEYTDLHVLEIGRPT